jgi:serine/threonine protein kinase
VSQDSKSAKDGHVGSGFTRSPEVTLQLPWRTSTDIWSFGNSVRHFLIAMDISFLIRNYIKVLSFLYGGNYHLFNPGIDGRKPEDEDYELAVLKRMYKFFGPYPQSYDDFGDANFITIINYINHLGPPEKPFNLVTRREIPPAAKVFILEIMKLDPRDRPTAEHLLEDEWFIEESENTRNQLPGHKIES